MSSGSQGSSLRHCGPGPEVTGSDHGGRCGIPPDRPKSTKQVVRVTSWSRRRPGWFWVEIVLAAVVGVAAFVVAAVAHSRQISRACRAPGPAPPAGRAGRRPLRRDLVRAPGPGRDHPGVRLVLSASTAQPRRGDRARARPVPGNVGHCRYGRDSGLLPRGLAKNMPGAYWPASRRRCGGWRRWSPASPRPQRSSQR